MKLRTSFFNITVLKKDITRFFPIWGVYSVICLLYLLALSSGEEPARFAYELSYLMPAMSVANGIYAAVCALFLFGDLFNSRLCNALHAMPLRREGWFLTHFAAGLLFCIVPNVLMAGLACIWLGGYSYMAFIWLGATLLQFLFFFGVAAFSAQCAGNRLGMLAVYGIVNFLSIIIYAVVHSLFLPMLEGVRMDSQIFEYLCPMWYLCEGEYVDVRHDYSNMVMQWRGFLPAAWQYLGICAGLGVVFAALAVLLYRKRRLESAGDFLALRLLQPVFLAIYTLGVAVLCYELGKDVELDFVFLAIGLVVGYFTGRMFVERKVNVFKPKALLGFGVLVVTLAAALGLTWLDPVGIARYVPAPEQIASVRIFDQTVTSHAYQYINGVDLTQPEELATVTEVHKDLVRKNAPRYGMPLTLVYKLKDGRTVRRYYEIDANSESGQALKPYFSRWEFVFGANQWDRLLDQTVALSVNNYAKDRVLIVGGDWYTEDYAGKEQNHLLELEDGDKTPIVELMEAMRADCEAGNLPQAYEYTTGTDNEEGWIELHKSSNDVISVRYTTDAVNTVACVEKLFGKAGK